MPDTGRQSDLLVVRQQAENHLVVAMMADGLQKNLEKLVNGPGLVGLLYIFLERNRHESRSLTILVINLS